MADRDWRSDSLSIIHCLKQSHAAGLDMKSRNCSSRIVNSSL